MSNNSVRKPESAWDRKRPCSPHSVGHSVKIKKYMVTHTRKSYSKGCNICIGNDGFFLGKRLSMGFHRSIVEPADPFELDPPTLKCAIPRFQRGPYYYHRSGRLLQICEPALQISFLQPQICRYLLELNYGIFSIPFRMLS